MISHRIIVGHHNYGMMQPQHIADHNSVKNGKGTGQRGNKGKKFVIFKYFVL